MTHINEPQHFKPFLNLEATMSVFFEQKNWWLKTIVSCFVLWIFFSCEKQDLPGENIPVSKVIATFGGSLNEVAQSVIATTDGGFAVLGHAQSNDGDVVDKTDDSFDFWLLKFDSDANLQWSKTYGGSGDDRGRSLIQTQDGGFALLGYSSSSDGDVSSNNGSRDFWLVKTDAQGNLSWEQSYGFAGSDEGNHILETSDGHFLMTGIIDVTASGGDGIFGRNASRHAGGDYWSLKVTQTGDLVWSRYYGGSFTDSAYGAVETSNQEFIIAGSSDSNDVNISNNKGTYDFWVVKAGSGGDLVWEQSYGGTQIDEARGIVSSGDGNFIIVGDTRSSDTDVSLNNGAADLWLVKISASGEILWNQSIGGANFDVPRSINPTLDGGFVIAGSSRSSDGVVDLNQGQNDAWVVKISNSGQLISQQTFGGSEIDFAYDAIQLLDGSIVLVGESSSSDGDITENKGFADLFIIKTTL
jgi:hypothetical protein